MTETFIQSRDRIMHDADFQAACQRYAHEGGSSAAIASAALRVRDRDQPSPALVDVNAERQRQIVSEGYNSTHDDAHNEFELARAASVYALYASVPELDREMARKHGPRLYGSMVVFPWADEDLKLTTPRRDLIKAAALLIAEIERLDRLENPN